MQIKKLIVIVVAVIVVLLVVGGVYALLRFGLIKSSVIVQPVAEKSISDQDILNRLKTIILLPDDVTPTMAVVMDAPTLIKQQPDFFANVKNGDRLIIYPDLVILYDYNSNKIIKVGPVQTAKAQ